MACGGKVAGAFSERADPDDPGGRIAELFEGSGGGTTTSADRTRSSAGWRRAPTLRCQPDRSAGLLRWLMAAQTGLLPTPATPDQIARGPSLWLD